MQSYIATASVADSSNMQWESFQDLGVSEDFDQTSEELLKSLFTFLVYGVYMTVRFALAVLISALFCFPCYYSEYAIVKNTVTFSMNKDCAEYILFAFYSSPVVNYGGYSFRDEFF